MRTHRIRHVVAAALVAMLLPLPAAGQRELTPDPDLLTGLTFNDGVRDLPIEPNVANAAGFGGPYPIYTVHVPPGVRRVTVTPTWTNSQIASVVGSARDYTYGKQTTAPNWGASDSGTGKVLLLERGIPARWGNGSTELKLRLTGNSAVEVTYRFFLTHNNDWKSANDRLSRLRLGEGGGGSGMFAAATPGGTKAPLVGALQSHAPQVAASISAAVVLEPPFEDEIDGTRQSYTPPVAARTSAAVELVPPFNDEIYEYSARVSSEVTEVTVDVTPSHPSATVTVNGGSPTRPVPVSVGKNRIDVVVTAENPAYRRTYTVTVTREKARVLSSNADLASLTAESGAGGAYAVLDIGAFSASTTSYAATVSHTTTHVRLTATAAHANATLKAGADSRLSAVASGAASAAISLEAGDNALAVEVTAEDGTTKTYAVAVRRAASPPLTAAFENVPAEHDGEGRFVLHVRFSEALGADGSGPSKKSFDVRGGGVNNVKRREDGLWRVRVKPDSWRDVTVTLAAGRACGEAGAVCTADGRALSNSAEASVGGPVRIRIKGGIAREGRDAGIDFAVTLNRASTEAVSVDYATADGTATAGEDFEAASGTLTFAAGETDVTLRVLVLDDDIDEGSENFFVHLSNASGAYLRNMHKKASGTIRNTDRIPAALLARFGRVTAEQVVENVEERLAAPRRRGFRARLAGREFSPGNEREFAVGFLTQFAPMSPGAPAGGPGDASAAAGSHAAGSGAFGAGADTTGMGAAGMVGAMGPQRSANAAGRGGLFGSLAPGGDLFSSSGFELNRESRGGMLSVWSRSSRSHFSGMDDALSLSGDVRTTMVGADWARGPLTLGLSVGHSMGLGGYAGASGGQMSTSLTGFYPWVGYQVNDRISVWGVTGYGKGSLSLTPDGGSALETGVSMAMTAVGTRGELLGSRATGGFSLAFKADALWVGAASARLGGAGGRLNASEAGVTRVRTALEGSRGFTSGDGRLSLTPRLEVGLRRDGGDAETGAGMDLGGGVAFADAVTGMSLDVRMRTLVAHEAEGFRERGMSLSFGWDRTPSSPLGLSARVAPSWGASAQGGAEALWSGQVPYGPGSHQMYGSGSQVNAEVGYGLPVGARMVGTPRVSVRTSEYGRDYGAGYSLGVLERGRMHFDLGIDAQRRESPMHGGASNLFLARATLGW